MGHTTTRWRAAALLGALGMSSVLTHADVVSADKPGFITRSTVSVAAPPADVYARYLEIGRWWNDDHTYSGKAANMSLATEPDGCWCEKLEGGGFVEHGRLVYLVPGKTLRFRGALGPLNEAGGAGTLTVQFEPEQNGTKVTFTYVALMFDAAKGGAALAPLFDQVLSEQLARLKKSAEQR